MKIMTKKSKSIYTPSVIIEGFWEIPGVNYKGKNKTYRIFEKMAPAMNHDDLTEYSIKEKKEGNPHLADSILHFSIFDASYKLRNKHSQDIEGLRKFLQSSLRKYPNTSTRVVYNPQEELDNIIHNYGTPDEYILRGNFVGDDGWIRNIKHKKVLTSLLGTDNIKKINEISQWLTNTNTYLWRLNSKPLQKDEGVVGFDASSGRLDLDCGRYPAGRCPAFRVLEVK